MISARRPNFRIWSKWPADPPALETFWRRQRQIAEILEFRGHSTQLAIAADEDGRLGHTLAFGHDRVLPIP